MTKDETIELWRSCEAARTAAALAGKTILEIHEAAAAVWNSWASSVLRRREELQSAGEWAATSSASFADRDQSFEFESVANFSNFTFPGFVYFHGVKFTDDVHFRRSKFLQSAFFDDAQFCKRANFFGAEFSDSALFGGARFDDKASFSQCSFNGYASFSSAQFNNGAEFEASAARRAFALYGTTFIGEPNFIQAHFDEAPALDYMEITPFYRQKPWYTGKGIRSRFRRLYPWSGVRSELYRALRRLAATGHDFEREQLFFSREIRSARFDRDWPLPTDMLGWKWLPWWLRRLPLAVWRPWIWRGFYRFWLGLAYQIFSDFGRSVLRPAGFWLFSVSVFAMVYLGQQPEIRVRRAELFGSSAVGQIKGHLRLSLEAIDRGQACTRSDEVTATANTDALREAFYLSIKNGLIFIDWDRPEANRRMYGCLYGFDNDPNKLPIIPWAVSAASSLQNVISAILIFLWGLGIRNMLRIQ